MGYIGIQVNYAVPICEMSQGPCILRHLVLCWGFVKWENLSNAGRKAAGGVKPQVCFLFHCEFVFSKGTLNSNCH